MITRAFFTRRKLPRSAASASLASGASLAESGRMPPYTLSATIEIMFPITMPRHKRMEVVAAPGDEGVQLLGRRQRSEGGLDCFAVEVHKDIPWETHRR